MSDTYHQMMRACLDQLHLGDRRDISVETLCRVVQICADTVTPPTEPEDPPALQWIRAFTLRNGDLVWQPDEHKFAVVRILEKDDDEMLRVEFDDFAVTWYDRNESVQVPQHRVLACEWNERQRSVNAITLASVTDID